jgi:hypothetical protein
MSSEAWATAGFIAMVFAIAVYYTVTAWFEHRERMAKIQQGINPDKEVIDPATGESVKK